MITISNPFYQNPEANARYLLQQQILQNSQTSLQQSLMEFLFLKSLLSQGHQLCLCIPLNGFSAGPVLPPDLPQQQWPCQKIPEPQPTQTKLEVCVFEGDHRKIPRLKSDECKVLSEGVEIVINVSELLPAEVAVAVEETSVRVEANHVGRDGTKNLWRQFDLPGCVNAEAARCLLTHDGFLYISVPWRKMEA